MTCRAVKIEARRNADFRRAYQPESRRFTFSGLTPVMTIRRGDVVLLTVTGTASVNGSVFQVVGDALTVTIEKADLALLDNPATPNTENEILSYDVVATDGTGFENWLLGGAFILLGLNAKGSDSCGTVEVSLGGECVSVSIEGGNIAAGSSVALAELNQAVADAETAAAEAEAARDEAVAATINKANRNGDNLTSGEQTAFRTAIGADLSANVKFQRAAANAVLRSVFEKLSDRVSVVDFGGIDDGTTNNDAAIAAAHAALPATGGVIEFPCILGSGYGVTDVTISKAVRFDMGSGFFDGAKFVALNATGDVFKVVGFGFVANNFNMSAAVTRTSGAYLKSTVPYLQIHGGYIEEHYIGLELDGTTLSTISDINFRNATPFSTAVNGGHIVIGRNTLVVALSLRNITSDTDFSTGPLQPDLQCHFGIRMFYADAVYIIDCDIIRSGYGLWRTPGTDQAISACYTHHSYFDNGRQGILDEPTGTGKIFRNYHDTVWGSSSTDRGFGHVGTPGTPNIFDNHFMSCQTQLNGNDGAFWNGGVKDHYISHHSAGQNGGAAISVGANATRWGVRSSLLGAREGLTGNAFGIFIDTGCSDYDIVDNDVTGNTSAGINDASLAANRKVRGNRGYLTKANGIATMLAANTSVTVNTGSFVAFPAGLINLALPLSLGAATKAAVTNSIAGSFQIVFDVAPGADVLIPWSGSAETI